jgi:cytochrome c-type biogenesis protein CcmF
MVTGYMAVFKGGQQVDTMYPARWFYRHHEDEPTTEVAIRRSLAGDLYITLHINKADIGNQDASLEIFVNPLVDWIWMGFGLMAIGTGIALLPEQAFSFALAKLPAEAVTTGIVLLFTLSLGAKAFAQQPPEAPILPRNAVEQQLHADINCMCGGCFGALKDCPMMYCQSRQAEKMQIRELVDQGKTHDEIVQIFIKQYGGQHVLNAPLDEGFNRLAWLLPYAVGATGITAVGLIAVKWSRRRAEAGPEAPDATDKSIDDRVNDELRNLD